MSEPTCKPYRPDAPAPSIKTLWLCVLLAATVLYGVTAQRTVSWQDSGMYQWRVLQGDYHGHLGLALAHPLYIAAGRVLAAAPLGGFAWKLNAFSGLGMAVALANLAALGAIFTGRTWIGLLVAAMLAVAHTAWWLSTIAEVYTWVVAGLTAEVWLLVLLLRRPRWWPLALLGLVNGLGLSLHNFALLPLPVYGVAALGLVWRRKLPTWSLAAAGGAWLVGAGPYLAMTAHLALSGAGWGPAVRSALFGEFEPAVTNVAGASRFIKVNAAISAMNFVNLLLPLAVIGWVRLRRRLGGGLAAALGAVTLIHVLFFVRYPVPDQFTFILPTLTMIALAACVGLAVLADAGGRWRAVTVALCLLSLPAAPAAYAMAPALARRVMPDGVRRRQRPFRDELAYWLVPWKHKETSSLRFARTALDEAASDGVIVTDDTAEELLRLVQTLEGRSPRVTIQFRGKPLPSCKDDLDAFRQAVADRPLWIVAPVHGYTPQPLLDAVDVRPREPDGALHRAAWKAPPTRPASARAARPEATSSP